jgi:hypothetical protein
MSFYTLENGRLVGPVSAEVLREKVESGTLKMDSAVRSGDSWIMVSDAVSGLPPRPQTPSPPQPEPANSVVPAQKPSQSWVIYAGIPVILFLLFIGIPIWKTGGDVSSVEPTKGDAYHTAVAYAKLHYPGFRRPTGGLFDAVIQRDGNAFNSPIRKNIGVILRRDGDVWTFVEIVQR